MKRYTPTLWELRLLELREWNRRAYERLVELDQLAGVHSDERDLDSEVAGPWRS